MVAVHFAKIKKNHTETVWLQFTRKAIHVRYKSINIKPIANQASLIGESKVSLQKEVVILLNRY